MRKANSEYINSNITEKGEFSVIEDSPINNANLNNLISLWSKYGIQITNDKSRPHLQHNSHWPHRCWLDSLGNSLSQEENTLGYLNRIPEHSTFPLAVSRTLLKHPLELELKKKWYCDFEQTAMALDLRGDHVTLGPTQHSLKIDKVNSDLDLETWVAIASEAFSYTIDTRVIAKVKDANDIQLLLARDQGQAVSCALLHKTSNTIGLHQFGVKKSSQGQGYAHSFMLAIIEICRQWQGENLVLQASQVGKPLYDKLGFQSQFLIRNYRLKLKPESA